MAGQTSLLGEILMAYVHCHHCNWEQDDFWSWGYNPLRWFFKYDLPSYIWPRMIRCDPGFLGGGSKFAKSLDLIGVVREVPVSDDEKASWSKAAISEGEKPPRTVHVHLTHSWYALWRSLMKWYHRVWTQEWWTYKSWRQAVAEGRGGCPKCHRSLCID